MAKVSIGVLAQNHFPRIGGMEIYYHMLARSALLHPTLDIAVACSSMPEVRWDFAYPYPVYRARSLSILTPYLYERCVMQMIRYESVNLLLGPMLHGGGYHAARLKQKLGLPVVVQSHGSDVQQVADIGYGAMLDLENAARIRYAIENADMILAQSALNRDMILKLGAPAERVRVVPPGLDSGAIDRIPFQDMRQGHGIAANTFVILTVGRNHPIKRLNLLLDALVLLRGRGVDFRYLCIGPTKDIRGQIAQRGLEGSTVLTGPVGPRGSSSGEAGPPYAEMINYYRAADLFVSVSYVEAFNLAALDALATGIPALVTARQGVVDHIEEGRTGFVLREETPPALAEMLSAIAAKCEVLRAQADEIRNSVVGLTWDRTLKELHSIAEELVYQR